MSDSTTPQQPSENEESGTAIKTTPIRIITSKSSSVTHRNKTPVNHSARSPVHGDNTIAVMEDGSTGGKLPSGFRRTIGKSMIPSVTQKKLPASMPNAALARLENQYSMKKKRYGQLKKELLDKQKIVQYLYDEISQLQEKLATNGAKNAAKPEDIKIFVGSPKQMTNAPADVPPEAPAVETERLAIGKETLDSLESKLQDAPQKAIELCHEVLQKQSSFVAFVTSRLISAGDVLNETDSINSELIAQLELHQKEFDVLRSRLGVIEGSAKQSAAEVLENVGNMVEKFESSRARLIKAQDQDVQKELQERLAATMEEVQAEREKNAQSRERIRQMEAQLQRSRTRIEELEMLMGNNEGKIQQLQNTIKVLEGQAKQKQLAMENKMKDMQKTITSSENLISKVEQQRDSFEARLIELKKKMVDKENEGLMNIKEMSERLTATTDELGAEREKRLQMETDYADLEERHRNLEEKCKDFCELAEKTKDLAIIEGNHTENEIRLFNELQAVKDELNEMREMKCQLQQEKDEIVAVMHQAASPEEEKDSREKLTAELVCKCAELQKLTMEYGELKKVAKNAQEKNGVLERQLVEIKTRLHSQSMEGGNAAISAHAIELQQQVSDLGNNLAEVIQQKEELENALTQKQLELEQRDHVMREQCRFLKARDELLYTLKGQVQQGNEELMNDEESNAYLVEITAKTEALQELYVSLKKKQLQIMKLEKMVKLMEEQQDRAQAQRTRLENRIAQLELTLHNHKEQRIKGFGIL